MLKAKVLNTNTQVATKRMLPDFLVLGLPKTGSTSLDLLLRKHPQICLPFKKEIWFFSHYFHKGTEWYEENFRHCHQNALRGEVTTNVLLEEDFPSRLKQVLPDGKFIVLLRDPVERCISHHFHNFRDGIDKITLEEAINKEAMRVSQQPDMYAAFAYVGIGANYKKYIHKLLSTFEQDQIKVVLLEELIGNEQPMLKSIFEFVGAVPFQYKLPKANPARVPRSRPLQILLNLPGSIIPLFDRLSFMGRFTPPALRWRIRAARHQAHFFCRTISESGKREIQKPAVATKTRVKLQKVFNQNLQDLDKLIEKPLSDYWTWYRSKD